MSPDLADGFPGCFAFVGAEIVEDHNIALGQCRDEHLLHVGSEDVPVDGSINHPRGINAVMAQRRDEGECLPVSVRNARLQPLTARSPAAQGGHVGLDPGFVEEDEPSGINPVLMGLPARPFAGDIRT